MDEIGFYLENNALNIKKIKQHTQNYTNFYNLTHFKTYQKKCNLKGNKN